MKKIISNYVLNLSIGIVSKILLRRDSSFSFVFVVSYVLCLRLLYKCSLSYCQKKCNFPFYAVLLTFYSDINIVCQPVIP